MSLIRGHRAGLPNLSGCLLRSVVHPESVLSKESTLQSTLVEGLSSREAEGHPTWPLQLDSCRTLPWDALSPSPAYFPSTMNGTCSEPEPSIGPRGFRVSMHACLLRAPALR